MSAADRRWLIVLSALLVVLSLTSMYLSAQRTFHLKKIHADPDAVAR